MVHEYAYKTYEYISKLANSPTNQLAVSQVSDWSTRGLVNSLSANFYKSRNYYSYYTMFVH